LPGAIVCIEKYSRKSYALYNHYKTKIPSLVCGCKWVARAVPLIVDSVFNTTVIVKRKDRPDLISVVFADDLDYLYE